VLAHHLRVGADPAAAAAVAATAACSLVKKLQANSMTTSG
jgi:hypothetical protein